MRPRTASRLGGAVCGALLLAGCAGEPGSGAPAEGRPAGDAYYLGVCGQCGGTLGAKGETIERVYGPRDARFCCAACTEAFERDTVAGLARIDRAMIADQLPLYPVRHSLVSGKALRDKPLDFIWGNRLFRVANARERAAVEGDTAAHLRALDRAVIESQRPTYAMPDKCPVQGDILPSDTPIDIVIANRMIRVCCMRCARVVRSRPSQYLSMVDHANRASSRDARAKGPVPSEDETPADSSGR